MVSQEVMRELFQTFDADHNGSISLHEILLGCSTMIKNESTVEKFHLLFDAFGVMREGPTLTAEEPSLTSADLMR